LALPMSLEHAPTPGAPEKAAVRSMFDRIAPRYDLLNHLLSAGIDIRWRRAAVDFLDLRMPGRVLDVCTGTADLLIEALGRDAARRGAGVDLSGEMLVRGQRKLLARGMRERGVLAAGDAERLPLRGEVFDGVLVAFGIRNVGDPASALREMARVLRPAGRAVVLEFSMPRGIMGRLYRFYFRSVLPRIGGLLSEKSAYSYLPASVERFATPEAFTALMEQSGFVDVRLRRLTGGIAHLYRGEKA
jgi:demethylmenaquinone methyltransferase/2-methoxy-6-polyprenyl-1,4-benzoquinol methylase